MGENMKEDVAQIRTELLAWAGLHRGKAISEKVMPRFFVLVDKLELVMQERKDTFPDNPNRQPRKISVTLDNGDIFEGIVYYTGNVTEQER